LWVVQQPFGQDKPREWTIFPYLLKEYRNRWFLFCSRASDMRLFDLALDRIKGIVAASDVEYKIDPKFNPRTYFKNVIGVTKHRGTPLSVVRFSASAEQAPYIETKPLHSSQMVVERNEETGEVIFQVEVILNFEFYALILSYGAGVKVLSPKCAVSNIRKMLEDAYLQYK